MWGPQVADWFREPAVLQGYLDSTDSGASQQGWSGTGIRADGQDWSGTYIRANSQGWLGDLY